MKKKLIPFIFALIITFVSFIILINISMGNIGNQEKWRIIVGLMGFLFLMTFMVFLWKRIRKTPS